MRPAAVVIMVAVCLPGGCSGVHHATADLERRRHRRQQRRSHRLGGRMPGLLGGYAYDQYEKSQGRY